MSTPATRTLVQVLIDEAVAAEARARVARFVHWDKKEHRHSMIRFVTPRPVSSCGRHRDPSAPAAGRRRGPTDASEPLVAAYAQLDADRSCLAQPTQAICQKTRLDTRSGRMKNRTTLLTNIATALATISSPVLTHTVSVRLAGDDEIFLYITPGAV